MLTKSLFYNDHRAGALKELKSGVNKEYYNSLVGINPKKKAVTDSMRPMYEKLERAGGLEKWERINYAQLKIFKERVVAYQKQEGTFVAPIIPPVC